ncbi:MAG: hypothetical protein ABIJ94_03720 [candidate division WOR-3 bacterium]
MEHTLSFAIINTFYAFSIYCLAVTIITLVLIFRPLNRLLLIFLIAIWLPVLVWIIAFLTLLAASPILLKFLGPFVAIFLGIFIVFKLMNRFLSGK